MAEISEIISSNDLGLYLITHCLIFLLSSILPIFFCFTFKFWIYLVLVRFSLLFGKISDVVLTEDKDNYASGASGLAFVFFIFVFENIWFFRVRKFWVSSFDLFF